VRLFGIDPSTQLLAKARAELLAATLALGYGEHLEFADASIDVVAATGIMHHVQSPRAVISEMFRVAKKAILISDHNNFAFGGPTAQRVRMILYCLGLLPIATFIKQGFRNQGYSEEDGWWYPYSLFNNFAQIAQLAETVHIMPTRPSTPGLGGNLLFSQSHVVIVATIAR
jgi:ubiquinone/menaquinone biosynthesis C-methylase UbiE